MTATRRARAVVISAVVVALTAGCTGGGSSKQSETPTPTSTAAVTVATGDAAVTYEASAFPTGSRPTVRAVTVPPSPFVDTLQLSTRSGAPLSVEVSAPTQPAIPVQVAFALDPADVPPGAVPAVFYLEPELGLWLPIESTMGSDGRLIGTAEHFTTFSPGLLWALDEAEAGASWLAYQTANVTGARAPAPQCDPGGQDGITVVVDEEVNAPLLGCAEMHDDGELLVKAVTSRAYSLALKASTEPTGAQVVSSLDTSAVFYKMADESGLRDLVGVWAPARATTELTWDPGVLPGGPLTIKASWSPGFAVIDPVVTAAVLLTGLVEIPELVLVTFADCLGEAVSAAGAGWVNAPSSLTNALMACMDPLLVVVEEKGASAAKKLLKALQVGLLLGQAGQSALDAGRDVWDSPGIVVWVAGDLPEPGNGGVPLHQVFRSSTGDGPSGEAADAEVTGGMRGSQSTTQWAGCHGDPASGTFDVGGFTRLKAVLGKRDFTPPDMVIAVSAVVDGDVVQSWTVADSPVAVDIELPAGEQLLLSATVQSGSCGWAPAGYLLWGNGAIYR